MAGDIKKPPLGLEPRWLHEEKRLSALRQAISRYLADCSMPIPAEWLEEYNELVMRVVSVKRGDNYERLMEISKSQSNEAGI